LKRVNNAVDMRNLAILYVLYKYSVLTFETIRTMEAERAANDAKIAAAKERRAALLGKRKFTQFV
jgi:hypothetical protein